MKNTAFATLIFLLLIPFVTEAQGRYFTRNGEISFISLTTMDTVRSVNHKATSFFDPVTHEIEVSALIKGFEFEKAALQERFNVDFMESDVWPKAIFNGKVLGYVEGAMIKQGAMTFLVAGDLTLHGKSRKVVVRSQWVRQGDGSLQAECTFKVLLSDHGIRVPSVLVDVIPDTVDLRVKLIFKQL